MTKALCTYCCSRRDCEMLTGYCIMSERCDGCGRVSDLALVCRPNSGGGTEREAEAALEATINV